MTSADRERLRTTFNEAAELYDRARPTYPPGVFADLTVLARLSEGAHVLEIGCGTGQATLPLAERGFRLVCVELGEDLATVARRKLAAFPNVEIHTATFETWEPTRRHFDAVVAFTAFHWVSPDARYEKAARILRDGGALGVLMTKHVLPDNGDQFFSDVQQDYRAVTQDDSGPPPRPEDVPDIGPEIEASGRFGEVCVRRYTWDVTYSADEYIDVLNTYSGHRALDDERRRELYRRIRRRIDVRPGRKVTKTYLGILHVARRL